MELLCGQCGQLDTAEHRVYECPASKIRDDEVRNGRLQYLVNGLGLPCYNGALPAGSAAPIFEATVNGTTVDELTFCQHDGDLFVDGSLYHGNYPWLASMAAAVVQPSSGKVVAVYLERSIPPSSTAAEAYALAVGVNSSSPAEDHPWHCWTDSSALCSSLGRALAFTVTNPNKMADGFARQIADITHTWSKFILMKTKAHRSEAQARQQCDLDCYLGNHKADLEAKRMNDKYGPAELVVRVAKETRGFSKKLLTQIVAALNQAEDKQPLLKLPRAVQSKQLDHSQRSLPPEHAHAFRRVGSRRWACIRCFQMHRVSPYNRTIRKCTGTSSTMSRLIARALAVEVPHRLHIAWERAVEPNSLRPVLLCTACGSYSSGTKCKLGGNCVQGRSSRALGRIKSKRHPFTGLPLEHFVSLRASKLQAVVCADEAARSLGSLCQTAVLLPLVE